MTTGVARWSTPFQVSPHGVAGRPVISPIGGSEGGEFVIVWSLFSDALSLGDDSGHAIYAQLYNQDGSTQGTPLLVNSTTSSVQNDPIVVARNSMEGFAVAFRDTSRPAFGSDVRLRLFDGNGAPPGADIVVQAGGLTEALNQTQHSMNRGEAFGAMFVTWTDYIGPPDGDGLDIRGRLFGDAGALGADFRVTATPRPGETGFQAQSNVGSLPELGFVVTWADNMAGAGSEFFGGGSHIRGQLYSYLGVPVGGQFDVVSTGVADTNLANVRFPQSAGFSDTGPDFVTVWVQDDDPTGGIDLNVHGRIFTISGTTVTGGADFIVSQTTTGNQDQIVVAAYENDRFIVVWTHQLPFQAPDVRARMFSADGTPLTAEFVVVPEDTLSTNFAGQLASVAVLDDTINAHPIPRFVVTWNDNANQPWAQIFSPAASQLLGIDWFGSDRAETYTAQYDERVLAGNGGADQITGKDTNDDIRGGAGNDTLTGGLGTDTLSGGFEDDTYIIDTFADVIVELPGEGTDTVVSPTSYIFHANVENVTLTGTAGNGVIGNDRPNLITGNSGANGITGGLGNDTINAGDGNDVLNGESGDDSMNGGSGVDVYFVDSIGDTIVEAAEAGVFDTIWTTTTRTLPENVEILILNGGTLVINGTGNDGPSDNAPNLMLGNNAANVLTTFGGDDIILGRDGNDTITTGAGSAAGVEIISGGVGNDTLTSGGGHDFFTYENINEAGDTITDFGVAGNDLDILDLRPMFFPTFTNLAGVTNVTQAVASGHLTFTQSGANTQVFADANGGGNNNVLLATLNNTTAATVQILTLI